MIENESVTVVVCTYLLEVKRTGVGFKPQVRGRSSKNHTKVVAYLSWLLPGKAGMAGRYFFLEKIYG